MSDPDYLLKSDIEFCDALCFIAARIFAKRAFIQ
jgi:hypothetical protein